MTNLIIVAFALLLSGVLPIRPAIAVAKDGILVRSGDNVYSVDFLPKERRVLVGTWRGDFRDPKFYGSPFSETPSAVLSSTDNSAVLFGYRTNPEDKWKEMRCQVSTKHCSPSTVLKAAQQTLVRESTTPTKDVQWTHWDAVSNRLFGVFLIPTTHFRVRIPILFQEKKKRISVMRDFIPIDSTFNPSPSLQWLAIIDYHPKNKPELLIFQLAKPLKVFRKFSFPHFVGVHPLLPRQQIMLTPEIVAWNRDESVIALATQKHLFTVNLKNGAIQRRYEIEGLGLIKANEYVSQGNLATVTNVAFSPSGRFLFFLEDPVYIKGSDINVSPSSQLKAVDLKNGNKVYTSALIGKQLRILPARISNQIVAADAESAESPRNIQRRYNVRDLATALELYFEAKGGYPRAPAFGQKVDGGCLSIQRGMESQQCMDVGSASIMIPQAPSPSPDEYRYFSYTTKTPSGSSNAACTETDMCASYGIEMTFEADVEGLHVGKNCLTSDGLQPGACPIPKE